MTFDYVISNPPFEGNIQIEIWEAFKEHTTRYSVICTKRLAKYTGTDWSYNPNWPAFFGNGLDIIIPIFLVTEKPSSKKDINAALKDELMEGLRREVEYVLRNKQNT